MTLLEDLTEPTLLKRIVNDANPEVFSRASSYVQEILSYFSDRNFYILHPDRYGRFSLTNNLIPPYEVELHSGRRPDSVIVRLIESISRKRDLSAFKLKYLRTVLISNSPGLSEAFDIETNKIKEFSRDKRVSVCTSPYNDGLIKEVMINQMFGHESFKHLMVKITHIERICSVMQKIRKLSKPI